MLRFLLGIVGVELRYTARRAAVTGLLFALGALMLSGAVVAFLVGCYILLAVRYDPIMAAFIICGVCLIFALGFFIVAYVRTRTPRRPGYRAAATFAASPPPQAVVPGREPASPLVSSSTIVAVAAGAALLGLILGRRI